MMLISNGICQYEGRYAALNKNICHFLGLSPSVFSEKNPKHGNIPIIQYDATLRSGFFFFGKHAWCRVLDFFHDLRIRVKLWTESWENEGGLRVNRF